MISKAPHGLSGQRRNDFLDAIRISCLVIVVNFNIVLLYTPFPLASSYVDILYIFSEKLGLSFMRDQVLAIF